MDLDFGGKTVLVVGGSSGIGNGMPRRSGRAAPTSMSGAPAPPPRTTKATPTAISTG